MIALRLARAGYWGGDPERVLAGDAELVIAAFQYELFIQDYERTFIELNKEKKA